MAIRKVGTIELIKKAVSSIPTPKDGENGRDGRDGKDGRDGRDGKDGVTTTIVKHEYEDSSSFATKEELEEVREEIRGVASNVAMGGGGYPHQLQEIAFDGLINPIEVSGNVTITDKQLSEFRINVIIVTEDGTVVTLPTPNLKKMLWVQKGFDGDGSYQVCTP